MFYAPFLASTYGSMQAAMLACVAVNTRLNIALVLPDADLLTQSYTGPAAFPSVYGPVGGPFAPSQGIGYALTFDETDTGGGDLGGSGAFTDGHGAYLMYLTLSDVPTLVTSLPDVTIGGTPYPWGYVPPLD
jgi:hypothetical protein